MYLFSALLISLILSVSPEDYEAVSTTLSFRTCNIRHCFRIYINDDCLVEDSEGFMVQMKRTRGLDSRILLSSEAAVVNITDNDSKPNEYQSLFNLYPGMISI